jgi:DNA-binding LytR/AlgR family response regulator
MSWTERISLYQEIEEHRARPLIVYVTSKREGVYATMSTDAMPFIIEQIDALPESWVVVQFEFRRKSLALELLIA